MADPSTLLFVTCIGYAPPPPIQTPQPTAALNQPSKAAGQSQLGSTPRPTAPQSFAAPNWSTDKAATPSVILSLNSQGAAVVRLQTQLRQLGYYKGTVDGFYGALTQTAVVNFQEAKRLKPDGIVGLQTCTVLKQIRSKLDTASPNLTGNSTQVLPKSTVPAQGNNTSFDIFFNVPFDIQTQHLLYLGLTVVYLGGWVLIFKDMAQELQGYRVAVSTTPSKDFEAAAKRITARATSGQKVSMVVQHSSVAENSLLPNKPITPQTPEPQPTSLPADPLENKSIQQHLAVVSANEGLVQPLHNLFVGLDQPKRQSLALRQTVNTPQMKQTNAKAKLEVVHGYQEETLVAMLSLPSGDQKAYTYALLDDAAGLFVLRGNQLRVINRLLRNCRFNERRVIVRRTDANGKSVDKSFQLEIQKIKQSIQPEPALVGVVS